MDRVVSLTTLLDGNSKRKKVEKLIIDADDPFQHKDDVEYYDETRTKAQGANDISSSIEVPGDLSFSTTGLNQQSFPEKERQSVQSLLMGRRNKKKETSSGDQEDAVIISLDNDDSQERSSSIDAGIPVVDPIPRHGNKVSYPANSKKTTLRNLFKGLKEGTPKPIELNSRTVASTFEKDAKNYRGCKRTSSGKKCNGLEAPFPSKQLTEPEDENLIQRRFNICLRQKSTVAAHLLPFEESEYESLNVKKIKQIETVYAKISTSKKKHISLWPQLLRPKSTNDVLLDPLLKQRINTWVSDAFVKLKRPTTRNKLLKRQKVDDRDCIDEFIVNDESENEVSEIKEFVPIMILFGEGIGKNTLIEMIMEELEGHVYDIDTSSNRSKKEILDSLREFSTTHYVKGKGSKGVILFDDVDVIFKEHDKFFWQTVEKILVGSRRPIVLLCRDINYIPSNIIQLANDEGSLFHAKLVSSRTVTKFLERYCQVLGLDIDRTILELLVKCNKEDIRKCLMDLQFACTAPGGFPIQRNKNPVSDLSSIKELAYYADNFSICDVLRSKTEWKSPISQDNDSTLMSPHAVSKLNQLTDDQVRLQNDYMIDYRLHLLDNLNQKIMPFELDISSSLERELRKVYPRFKHVNCRSDISYDKMKRTTISYLSTRVNFQNNGVDLKGRRTRNSRKFKEILDRFNGKFETSLADECLEYDFDTSLRKNIEEQVNPYVFEIAKVDAAVKEKNKAIFIRSAKGLSKDQHNEVVYSLMVQGLIKPIWFRADPKRVIESWNLLTCTKNHYES